MRMTTFLWLPDGTLYVANNGDSTVEVFAPGACGNVTPLRTIAGSSTGLSNSDGVDGLGVDSTGTLYADNTGDDSIEVFAPGANGNVAPIRTIVGGSTGLGGPDDIIVGFTGQLYVTNGFVTGTNSITVYAPGASGNASPTQQIVGSNTDFGNPDDLAVDAAGDMFVTDAPATVGPAVGPRIRAERRMETRRRPPSSPGRPRRSTSPRVSRLHLRLRRT